MRPLFLLFIVVPILEMLLLFRVAEYIGALATLGLVLLTAAVGIQILRQQGLATLTRANQRISSGELPAQEMLEGLLLAVGGAFLLTPGFITDAAGFLLLIGPGRRLLISRLLRSGNMQIFTMGSSGMHYRHRQSAEEDVIEAEFEREAGQERQRQSRLEDHDRP